MKILRTTSTASLSWLLVLPKKECISGIFDSLGILSPIVINLKLLFQELCFMKIDWDVSLAIQFVNKWRKVLFEISQTDIICLS